jgi:hypothetical protein
VTTQLETKEKTNDSMTLIDVSCDCRIDCSLLLIQRRRVLSRDKSWFLSRVGGTEHASRRTFMTLQASDFGDYLIMLVATSIVSTLCYGAFHALNLLAVAMCVWLAVAFPAAARRRVARTDRG